MGMFFPLEHLCKILAVNRLKYKYGFRELFSEPVVIRETQYTKEKKMRTKFLVFTVLAFALILSACGPATINQAAQPIIRTLNVNGLGTTYLTPDIAYIYIGVHNEGATASETVTANKTQTAAVLSALKKAGVEDKDLRTTNFSIYPSQQYDANGVVTGTIYIVDNTVYVTVRNLDGLGALLDDTISAGANSINSIQFDVADKTAAVKEARAKGVQDAQTQAKELAAAAGITLGDIQNISYYDNSPVPMMADGKGGGSATNAAVAIQPGQLTISVSVSITYGIK
jgi:uncharacterized protein YggE